MKERLVSASERFRYTVSENHHLSLEPHREIVSLASTNSFSRGNNLERIKRRSVYRIDRPENQEIARKEYEIINLHLNILSINFCLLSEANLFWTAKTFT